MEKKTVPKPFLAAGNLLEGWIIELLQVQYPPQEHSIRNAAQTGKIDNSEFDSA